MVDGVGPREEIIAKCEDILNNKKLEGLDPEVREVCQNAITRMVFELRTEVANIKRNVSLFEDYREDRQAKRP